MQTDNNPGILRRKTSRLQNFNYSASGYYFLTICTFNKQCLFGEIAEQAMQLNEHGAIVSRLWLEISSHFPNVETDAFVVMPNHIHGILIINAEHEGTACRASALEKFGQPVKGSIPTIIRSFKGTATRDLRKILMSEKKIVWQRGYWDRVIRNQSELEAIREYIRNNPLQWHLDKLNPENE